MSFESGSNSIQKAERWLAERFRSNLKELEDIFSEVLSPAVAAAAIGSGVIPEETRNEGLKDVGSRLHHFLFHSLASSLTSTTVAGGKKIEPSVVLLLEPGLQTLPWEGLSFFQGTYSPSSSSDLPSGKQSPVAPFYSISRDFSIHFFHHRMKAIAADLNLPALINLPSSSVRYAVDPFDEDAGNQAVGMVRKPLQEIFEGSINGSSALIHGGKKWQKLRSSPTGNLALQDWIVSVHNNASLLPLPSVPPTGKEAKGAPPPPAQIASAQGVFVQTLGRFGSLLAPQELSSLDLEKVLLLCVFDQGHNEASARRQVSADVVKAAAEVELEQPLNMMGLLALSGPAAVVAHAWSTPLTAQSRLLQTFWQPFSAGTASTVSAALSASSYYVPPVVEVSAGHQKNSGHGGHASRSNSLEKDGDRERRRVKLWIRSARILFGLPNIAYSDA